MGEIRLDQCLADDSMMLLVGEVLGAADCRELIAEIFAPGGGRLSFVEGPTEADGAFRLMLPLQPVAADARPSAAPVRLSIRCAQDPADAAWPAKGKPDLLTLNCRPELTLEGAPVDSGCVGGRDGGAVRVIRPKLRVRRLNRLGDILVGVELLTGSIVHQREILVCRGEARDYELTTELRAPGGMEVTWRAGLLGPTATAPLVDVIAGGTIALAPCFPDAPSDPPEPPPDPVETWQPPAWCLKLPVPCGHLLCLSRFLLLAGLMLFHVGLVLAPPDWALRVAGYMVRQQLNTVLSGVQETVVTTIAGAGGSGTAGGAVGGVAGSVAPIVGNIIGGLGGAGAGAMVGGASSGSGAAMGQVLTASQRAAWDAVLALFDGAAVVLGLFLTSVSALCVTLGLLAMLLWWLCCGRARRCAIWTETAWVLEVALIVMMPVAGVIATLVTGALSSLGAAAAVGRISTGFFLQFVIGVLIGTLLYGFVRWRRDANNCPVRPLWLWPWQEKRE